MGMTYSDVMYLNKHYAASTEYNVEAARKLYEESVRHLMAIPFEEYTDSNEPTPPPDHRNHKRLVDVPEGLV